jgi:hypothetical protein
VWALAGVAGAVWGSAFLIPDRPAPVPRTTVPVVAPSPLAPQVPGPLPVFASSDGVRLRLVSGRALAIAFHEASYRDATALRPWGECVVCRNRTKFTPPPSRGDLSYLVTDTRGRRTPATSAADIVLPRGQAVLAPVSGRVTAVKRYRLYYRYPDVRVEIRPAAVPERRVVLIHLAGVRLAKGDAVEASVTKIGAVRRFPFESQVDRYVGGRYPHVHLEVKNPARAPSARQQKK